MHAEGDSLWREIKVAKVVAPVIYSMWTPDICPAFSQSEKERTQFQMSNLSRLKLL